MKHDDLDTARGFMFALGMGLIFWGLVILAIREYVK
jgi:hypothetical protein